MCIAKGRLLACAWALLVLTLDDAYAQTPAPVKIAVPVFLSGPAVGAFGEPSRNAAEVIVKAMNAGELPPPYHQKGLAGAPIELKVVDEAGSTATVVSEFKSLVQRDKADVVIGYVSSTSCVALAPIADELQVLTVIYSCGTSRLFDEGSHQYVFRVASTQTSDDVAAARYIGTKFPGTNSFSGINPNYSWGQDNWRDFTLSMKTLVPNATVDKELFTKPFAGEFGAEISTLLASGSPIIHTSLWGGDLETFLLQATARGLTEHSRLLLTVGEHVLGRQAKNVPDGSIIGARGRNGLFASANPLNQWFHVAYIKKFNTPPNFAGYHMLSSFLGLKTAWEKAAAAKGGARPSTDEVAAAFTGLSFETASGPVKMALGKGHQGMEEMSVGIYAYNKGTEQPELRDPLSYPAECVNPPPDMTSEEWLKKGMPGAKC
jgi:branched-chain amino acid transport system substrate-binding protein